jgi:hypothetical protein
MTTRPLSHAESVFIEQNPTMPLGELAKALGRDANEIVTLKPAAKTTFEKQVTPIVRNNKRVGVISTARSSAHMDEISGYAPGSTRTTPQPPMVEGVISLTAGTDNDPHCVHVLRSAEKGK